MVFKQHKTSDGFIRKRKNEIKSALCFHVSALNKALFWMYCTYENKYKFVERSVNCCRDPAPHGYLPHVFSDERNNGPMMFYFLACTFLGPSAARVKRPGWGTLAPRWRQTDCRHFYCSVLPRFNVRTVKRHGFVCSSVSGLMSECHSCVSSPQGFIPLLVCFTVITEQTPDSVVFRL